LAWARSAGDHFGAHFLGGDFGHPAEFLFGFGGVAQQGFDFGGAEVAGVDADDGFGHSNSHFVDALAFPAQLHAQLCGGPFNELAHAVLHAGGNDKVFGLVLLQHHPLHAHIVFGVAPVAQGVDVAHVQALFQALADVGQAAGDFAGDKGFATARAFVVEQDAVAGIHAIGLAVVDRDPVGVELGHGVGAAWVKGVVSFCGVSCTKPYSSLRCWLGRSGFSFPGPGCEWPPEAQGAHAVNICGVFGAFKTHGHMALCAQVVNFIGLGFLNDAHQVTGVAQVTVVQLEAALSTCGSW
jgi:hypothetical protein